jgi:post-segregation antitoxin (ccd killing protein)
VPNVTLYLPDDLNEYARSSSLKLSALLQDAIHAHQNEHSELEQRFREELEKYRTSPDRRAEWDRMEASQPAPQPFRPCPVCGTGIDEAEGCMAIFEPYGAAAVALLAHFPDGMRRQNLQYWADSGYKDTPVG